MASKSMKVALSIVACPDCELPAEILERFALGSTDGMVDHVAVACVSGHYFRMPAAGLFTDQLIAESPTATDQPADASPSGLAVSRMPGRMGFACGGVDPAIWPAAAVGKLRAVDR